MRILDAVESQHYHRVQRLTAHTARAVGRSLVADANMPMQHVPDELRAVHHVAQAAPHDWLRVPRHKFCADKSAWRASLQIYEVGRCQ